jgi:hypothetical protein
VDPFAPPAVPSQLTVRASARFAELGRNPRTSGIDFAVADLTKAGNTTNAPVYGRNVTRSQYIASVGKVAAMLAAFWLRRNFRTALARVAAPDLDDAFREIRTAWARELGHSGFPDVRKIFQFATRGTMRAVDFSADFAKDLLAMVGFSDTIATGNVVNALKLPYIAGTMRAARLYESGKGGLYLGGDYRRGWGLTSKADPVTGKAQAGSPLSLVDLLSRLNARTLVSSTDSDQMILLMSARGSYSWTSQQAPRRSITRDHFGKLGIYTTHPTAYSDAAYMHRLVNLGRKHVEIKYAIAATNIRKLEDYGVLLRDIEYILADTHARGLAHVL